MSSVTTPEITTSRHIDVTTSTSSLSASILSLLTRQSFSSSRSLRRAVHSQHPSCGDKEVFKGVFKEALRGLVEEGRIERSGEEGVIRLVEEAVVKFEPAESDVRAFFLILYKNVIL
jgi:uncharacterized protein YbbK (DUF523 family)